MKQFAVIGNPISHSKSPLIHEMFAKECGIDIGYEKILSAKGDFPKIIHNLISKGYLGCNVTLPFKEEAFSLSQELSERAKLAGAVNTLSFCEGKILGDNTDGQGLVEDLLRTVETLHDKRILLIGAGGAAKGCIYPLLQAGVSSVRVVNRTMEKAQSMVAKFTNSEQLSVVSITDLEIIEVDIIINSTSTSLSNELPFESQSVFRKAQLAYDMVYKEVLTSFEEHAIKSNSKIQTQSGFGMLVGQAAESFRIWHDVKPNISPVIERLLNGND